MTAAPIAVCLAGATGWAGSELARAIAQTADIVLTAAVSRTHAGAASARCSGTKRSPARSTHPPPKASRTGCDVFVEYTKPDSAKANVLAALKRGAHVVIGTSGLTEEDYAEIDAAAQRNGLGVLAVGNFALTVVLLQKFAEMAAKVIPQWEIIDYAHDDKVDAPSGTARELATRLSRVRRPEPTVPIEQTVGEREARGATLSGRRCTRCGFRASSSAPKSSSACPIRN